jgi:hypothetical protein
MTSLLDRVKQSLKWKKAAQDCADRIGINLEDYQALKSLIIDKEKETFEPEEVKEGIISENVNLEKGSSKIEAISTTEPKSPEDIIKILGINTDEWKLSQYWNKQKQDYWSVSALVTKIKPTEVDNLALAVKNYKASEYLITNCPRIEVDKNNNYCGVFSVQDVHFGKQNNNSVIDRFKEAIVEAAYKASRAYNLEKLYYVVGGDLLNADTFSKTTTKGTPVENDMDPIEAYQEAFDAVVWSVHQLKEVCEELVVVYIPGNHDRLSSWHLAHALEKSVTIPSVTFDVEYQERKVHLYGDNFLAFEHGDVNTSNSDRVYAAEFPKAWGETTYRTLYTGHYHQKKTSVFVTENEINGFAVKIMPSLSNSDYWHYHNKYVGSKKAAVLEVHEAAKGKVAEFCHIAK